MESWFWKEVPVIQYICKHTPYILSLSEIRVIYWQVRGIEKATANKPFEFGLTRNFRILCIKYINSEYTNTLIFNINTYYLFMK